MLRQLLITSILAMGLSAPAFASGPRIIILGDSLTDGYGVSKERAYPAILQNKLRSKHGADLVVVNAGISGSTTASAESRLKWHLKSPPDILVVALGANDGLRGVPLTETRKNLSKVIESARERKIAILLAGMKLPPNYGKDYTEGFEKLYRDLSSKYNLPLVPFLLEGVGGEREMNQEDGIHPNEKGHERMAENVMPHLERLLAQLKRKSP